MSDTDLYTAELARHREHVAREEQAFIEDQFNAPAARRTDPATSHEAAASVVDHAANQRAEIMAALREFGPATNDALDARLGYRVGTASRRTTELYRMGLIIRGTDTRETRTGRRALVLHLSQQEAA